MDNPTTSWSYDDLKNLTNLANHRVKYDGYEYIWEHKLSGRWSLHSIKHFDTVKTYLSQLAFTVSLWKKELSNRDKEIAKEEKRLHNIEARDLDKKYKTVIKISKRKLKPIKKVELILNIDDTIPNEMIYKAIGISKVTFYKYLKQIKND